MREEEQLYVVSRRALPDVLLQVVEAKRLLEQGRVRSVQEATEKVGISRSSFYKYKDEINTFYDHSRGKTVTFLMQMDDEPGALAAVLDKVSKAGVNILTIHQSIPVNGSAMITISVEIAQDGTNVRTLMSDIEAMNGIQYIKVLARE